MFGIHRGDLPQSKGQRLNFSHTTCNNSEKTQHTKYIIYDIRMRIVCLSL